MILILTQEANELTTEHVMDWLRYFDCECLRLNGEDLIPACAKYKIRNARAVSHETVRRISLVYDQNNKA
jgi:hypothetical protein